MPLRHSVEEIELQSGARGLLIDAPGSTVVAYNFHFRAGFNYADESKYQTAHIMEHLTCGSNQDYPSTELFSREFNKNGARYNATTSEYNMSYTAECAVMEWERILNLEQAAITRPEFTQKALDREKSNVKEEVTGYINEHQRFLWKSIKKSMGYPGVSDAESVKTIDDIQLYDVEKHHEKTHTLENMRFTIAADLSTFKNEIINNLNQWDLPVGNRLPVPKVQLKSSPMVYVSRKDLTNHIYRLHIVIDREMSESEILSMRILNYLLTGTFHSRIYGEARSRGLCYGISSSCYNNISGNALWEIYGQVGDNNAKALFQLIVDQITKVVDGDVSEKELEDAKLFYTGNYQMRHQTTKELSDWYSTEYFNYELIDYLDQYPGLIQSITLDSIVELAKEYIEKGYWTLGFVSSAPEGQLQPHYDSLSKLLKNGAK
jgi:zinc protease